MHLVNVDFLNTKNILLFVQVDFLKEEMDKSWI